ETADDQVHLAHPAPPGAEQEPAPALIQSFARSLRHDAIRFDWSRRDRKAPTSPTPKARTRPGEAYIEGDDPDVSGKAITSLVIPGRGCKPRAGNPQPQAGRN